MFTIRATKKLADHVGQSLASEAPDPTARLGDWYANRVYIAPKQHVIFVNASTLMPVIVPLAPAKTLVSRFVQQYGLVLRALGIDEASIAIETASMGTVTWAKTADRSVVGSMNEFIKFIEFGYDRLEHPPLTELALRLGRTPCRAGGSEPIWPDRETRDAFSNDIDGGATTTGTVHQLKVTLRTVKPAVWRRIEVPSTMPLDEVSHVLEAAMGWMGGHLHSFQVGDVHYSPPDPDGFFDSPMFTFIDESTVTLGDVLPKAKSKMEWDYDFGDGWQHNVVVEEINAADPEVTYPICVAGSRACPPEDCGGPWGYDELVEALADPSHERHDELREWAPYFDAAHFDKAEATTAMQSERPLRDWF